MREYYEDFLEDWGPVENQELKPGDELKPDDGLFHDWRDQVILAADNVIDQKADRLAAIREIEQPAV